MSVHAAPGWSLAIRHISSRQPPRTVPLNVRDLVAQAPLRVGYACAWWRPRQATWSYTALRLRDALAAEPEVDVVDIEAQRSIAGKAALSVLYGPRPRTPWQYSAVERRLLDRAVRRGASRQRPDVLLAIGEVDTPAGLPTFLYQDANIAAVLAHEARTSGPCGVLLPSSTRLLGRRAAEQLTRCRDATGIFVMGQWFADFLSSVHGIDPSRIVVVPAGMNNVPVVHRNPRRPSGGRVLFIGTRFALKGGDLVVEAVRRLNRERGDDIRLTIAGPARWPLPGSPPPFVDFKGFVEPATVSELYAEHDVFAMPSRFDAFGIVLAEALVAGLPCVARRAFAMPEIVDDGVTGALVDTDDPDELAAALASQLDDPGVFVRVADARPALEHRYSWVTSAASMSRHMREASSVA